MINVGKLPEPLSIGPDVELNDALEVMRSWGSRHLPVTDKNGMVLGVLSERDVYHFKAMHPGSKKALVQEAMSSNAYVVKPEEALVTVAETMAHHKYGCAIVSGPNGICGIFTTVDALRILVEILSNPGDSRFSGMKIDDYIRSQLTR